jgi:DNA modification methylase
MKSTELITPFARLRPVHPFPARMAPEIALSRLRSGKRLRVMDPMVGSGTSVVLASMLGHEAFGYDSDPLALLIANTWCSKLDEPKFRAAVGRILAAAKNEWPDTAPYPSCADSETKEFLRYWFDPDTRKKLAAISARIDAVKSLPLRMQLWCVFSRLIVVKDNGVSLARDVSHSRPHRSYDKAPGDPFVLFPRAGEQLIRTLKTLPRAHRQVSLKKADARNLPVRTASIDLVITSPPYLNAIDYMRGHRMSLVWMGYSLERLRKMRSDAVGAEVGCDEIPKHLTLARKAMGKLDTLGPRLQRMVNKYVVDMSAIMAEIARVLRSNGIAVVVVGNSTLRGIFLKNSELIVHLSKLHGLKLSHRRWRRIPNSRRYLPPPSLQPNAAPLASRMRTEVVLTFTSAR